MAADANGPDARSGMRTIPSFAPFVPPRRASQPETLDAATQAAALRESLNLIMSPLVAALGLIEVESPARGHVETSLRAIRRLVVDLERSRRGLHGRPASSAIDLRKFKVTGILPRRRASTGGAQPKVLLVEDAPEQRAFLSALMSPYSEVTAVGSASDALAILAERSIDVVVTDLIMPEMRGDELCLAVRSDPTLSHVRLVVLTAVAARNVRDELLAEVVDDYLHKPIDPTELEARVVGLARMSRAAKALHDSARTDALTGLPNRKGVLEALETAAALAQEQIFTGVLLLDVDHFKRVNDRYGHGVGDEVLCELARRITTAIGKDGSPGRYGGEEFLVVFESAADAQRKSEELLHAIRSAAFETSAGALPITVSAGLARFGTGDAGWSTVVDRADKRLYEAKRAGRDHLVGRRAEEERPTIF